MGADTTITVNTEKTLNEFKEAKKSGTLHGRCLVVTDEGLKLEKVSFFTVVKSIFGCGNASSRNIKKFCNENCPTLDIQQTIKGYSPTTSKLQQWAENSFPIQFLPKPINPEHREEVGSIRQGSVSKETMDELQGADESKFSIEDAKKEFLECAFDDFLKELEAINMQLVLPWLGDDEKLQLLAAKYDINEVINPKEAEKVKEEIDAMSVANKDQVIAESSKLRKKFREEALKKAMSNIEELHTLIGECKDSKIQEKTAQLSTAYLEVRAIVQSIQERYATS